MSSPTTPVRTPRRWGALLLVLGASSAASAQTDAFAVHLRWRHAPPSGAGSLPGAVDFAAGGELVGAAASVGGARWSLASSGPIASADLAPEREAADALAVGALGIAGDPESKAFFALAQHATGSATLRATDVVRLDVPSAAAGAAWAETWRHTLGLVGNGAARIACSRSGGRVVVAAHDAATSTLEIRWIDGATGAMVASRTQAALTLRALAISADGARAAFVAGAEVDVVDDSGALVYWAPLGSATNALALSGDGRTIAVGAGPRLVLLRESAGVFTAIDDLYGGFGELPVRAALSHDGETLAIGWWSQANGTSVRFQVAHAGAIVAEELLTGSPYGLQNYPEAVAITPDGRRAAFGAWGTLSTEPEVFLYDRDGGERLFAFDLPGSVRALALDASGTRVAVALKHGHANQFGSTGEVRLYDTGERDLQVVATPRASGTLELAARVAGASRGIFLVGPALAAPVPFAGASGSLAIDRSAARTFVRPADAGGRADVSVPLPANAAGLGFAAQAAMRVGGALVFTETVVEPAVF
jgi:hypothetical protein